jgi:GDP-L-fucose synthase
VSAASPEAALRVRARTFVAGHAGLVGSAVVRRLAASGAPDVLTVPRAELDLRDPAAVDRWFARERPEHVVLVAGHVGGILANTSRPAELLHDNLLIAATVIHAAHVHGVAKLLYLGSSCIYPRLADQPMAEDALLTGPLEPTNEGYAVAKIAGVKLCQTYRAQYGDRFISALPTNVYGPGDNFDPADSHVVAGMLRRFHDAKAAGRDEVELWGTGSPRRELLHVDDLADACLFLLDRYDEDGHVNVGTGVDVTIRELAETVRDVVHPTAQITYDATKPDGMPRKVLDVSRLAALGWTARTPLADGIRSTYDWVLAQPPGGVRGWDLQPAAPAGAAHPRQ